MRSPKADEQSVAEALAVMPALTLQDVLTRVEALSEVMRLQVRPEYDLERRLVAGIRAGLRRLLPG